MRASTILQAAIATAFIWFGVLMVRLIGGAEAEIASFALFVGIGSTVALWLVWAFMGMEQATKSSSEREKAKHAPEDARLSLLLQMLDDDERRALKDRLRGELRADGEGIPLDDLLEDKARRS